MSRVRPGVVAAGLLAAAAVAVLVSLGGPRTAVPAAPVTPTEQVEYRGYRFDPRDPEIARRLAAGEDPETIPGVIPGDRPGPLTPSGFSTDPSSTDEESAAGEPTPR